MTAYRVIDDHKELDNIGSNTHDDIDVHIDESEFLVVSGSAGVHRPPKARALAVGNDLTLVDEGPGGDLKISSYVFPSDLTVSLTGGRTFGRYASGQTIPATGKTPAEVIRMAIAEPIAPTVSLSSPTTIAFNQTSVSNVLNFSYTINTLGGSVSTAVLEWRRNNAGSWTTLTNNVNAISVTHNVTDTAFNTQSFNYRYIVVDSAGATTTATLNITPQGYAAPSMSLSVVRNSSTGISGETNTKREKGNVGSTLSGTISKNRTNVPMTSYSVQYSTNNSTWSGVPGLTNITISGDPSSVTIPATSHDDASLKSFSNIYYRITVTDSYTTSTSSSSTVSFLNAIFYGTSATAPSNSDDVRLLSNRVFTTDLSNPFILNTGNTERIFTVAFPSPTSITSVFDLDALNANITNTYILSSVNVNDGGGIETSYKVYTMTNAIPYDANHRHQITRA